MKATILTAVPFILPYGTRLRLTKPARTDGYSKEVFFAGYRSYKQEFLTNAKDLFPVFKGTTKDGRMSNRNPDGWVSNTIGPYDLQNYELEILELPTEHLHPATLDCHAVEEVIIPTVAVRTEIMLAIARKYGITRMDVSEDTDPAFAVFEEDETEDYRYEKVTELLFDQKEKTVTVKGETLSGYLDCTYGDFFNIGQSFPNIWRVFVNKLQKMTKN